VTVAFVTYKSGGVDRRVGPLLKEQAEPMSKDLAKQAHISDVYLEEWVFLRSTPVFGGGPA
jgi:hypothetical protein